MLTKVGKLEAFKAFKSGKTVFVKVKEDTKAISLDTDVSSLPGKNYILKLKHLFTRKVNEVLLTNNVSSGETYFMYNADVLLKSLRLSQN